MNKDYMSSNNIEIDIESMIDEQKTFDKKEIKKNNIIINLKDQQLLCEFKSINFEVGYKNHKIILFCNNEQLSRLLIASKDLEVLEMKINDLDTDEALINLTIASISKIKTKKERFKITLYLQDARLKTI